MLAAPRMRAPTRSLVVQFVLSMCAASVAAQAPAGDKSADLRAKEVDKRLAAIDWAGTSGRKDLETVLMPMLADRDWEIQERLAMALGAMQCKAALPKLVDLAVDGDVVRVRRAAAFAVAAIDAAEGAAAIYKRAKGKTIVEAQESLALVLRSKPAFADADKLKKLLRDASAPVRESAAVAPPIVTWLPPPVPVWRPSSMNFSVPSRASRASA